MTTKQTTLAGLALASSLMLVNGCGGSGDGSSDAGSAPAVSGSVFAINSFVTPGFGTDTNTLQGFTIASTGTPTAASSLNLGTLNGGAHITAVPRGKFLFSVQDDTFGNGIPSIKGFVANPSTGTLASTCPAVQLPASRLPLNQPALVPSETLIYVTSRTFFDIYQVDTNGCPKHSLTIPAGAPVIASIASPDGKYLFTLYQLPPDPTANIVQSSLINATTGDLTQINTLQSVTNANGIRIQAHPTGRFLYVSSRNDLGNPGDGVIQSIQVDATGKLSASLAPTPGELQDFAIHPAGAFLYGVSNGSKLLDGYRIDPTTGNLTHLSKIDASNTTFVSDAHLAFSPDGTFLYVGDSHALVVYQVGSDGVLTLVPDAGVPTLPSAEWEDIVVTQ